MTDAHPDLGSQPLECAINRAGGGRPIPGNSVRLLIDGPDAYAAMLDVIAGARTWVHFENYIIRSDAEGWRFGEALAARAREGVAVRLVYDWLGSIATSFIASFSPGRSSVSLPVLWKLVSSAPAVVKRSNAIAVPAAPARTILPSL